MARFNLSERKDIAPDVLRQRRDFYAVALGLLLFQLAQGSLQAGNTLGGGILPIRFANPCWFLWAAWTAFVYFLIRYRMMAPAAFQAFLADGVFQAGDSIAARRVFAAHILQEQSKEEVENQTRAILNSNGAIPRLRLKNGTLHIIGIKPGVASQGFHTDNTPPTAAEQRSLRLALLRGLIVATWRERAFTDYLLPYIVGAVTVGVGLLHWSTGATHVCLPWLRH